MHTHRLIEIFWQAFFAVKENRTRSIMSVVGIAVGIASVMIVGMVSESGRDYIYSELESFGLNSLWVYRDWEQENPFANVRQGSGITNDDLEAMRSTNCCPDVIAYSPVVYPKDWMISLRAGNQFHTASVGGVGVEFMNINNDTVQFGRNFRDQDISGRKKVALIGSETVKKLFGDSPNVVGRTIRMGEIRLVVIGVLAPKKRDMLSAIGATGGYDENDRLLIPYTLYQQILGTKDIHTLRALAASLDKVDIALQQLTGFLDRRNSSNYKYKTESMLEWIGTTNKIVGIVKLIGGVAALVALVVGGIGIFNIMSSSVIERTHEIGVLKAIGAYNKDILLQFLCEAGLVSMAGGVVGCLIGLFALLTVSFFLPIPVTPAWGFLFLGLVIAILVGVVSGMYPAKRAANLPPAVALRYD